MTELLFRRDLYSAAALTAACRAFESVATVEVTVGGDHHRVRLAVTGNFPESRVIDEFRNYALGATIEEAIASDSASHSSPGASNQEPRR